MNSAERDPQSEPGYLQSILKMKQRAYKIENNRLGLIYSVHEEILENATSFKFPGIGLSSIVLSDARTQ